MARYELALVLTFVAIVLVRNPVTVNCANITDAENLHTTLLTGYNKDVRPINNQSSALNVTLYSYLRSIQDLDELTGELAFTGAISMDWVDSKMTWNPLSYGGLSSIYISYSSVWVPEIVITTTTETSDTMAKKWQQVKFDDSGSANFVVGGRIKATCSVDVKNYPFDKQICRVKFTAWGYDAAALTISAGATFMNTAQYSGHSVWELAKTETSTYVLDSWPYYEIAFFLERKASFTIVNLVVPLLLMSFLNVLVFLLVPDSGERISYSVTVLLAVAVFLTIVSDELPASSDPVPVITYKLMADMIISVFITTTTILNLSLYHRDDEKPVPKRLQTLYKTLKFELGCCSDGKLSNSKVGISETVDTIEDVDDLKHGVDHVSDSGSRENNIHVTWKDISFMVDFISLVFFSIASFLSFLIYIIKVMS